MKTSELFREVLESGDTSQRLEEHADITDKGEYTNIEKSYHEWKKYYDGEEIAKAALGDNHTTSKERKYQEALELARNTDYSMEALKEFLSGDWHEKFREIDEDTRPNSRYKVDGVFVSAFVNQLDAEEVVLPDLGDTSHVGYRNRKDIVIEGDAETYTGDRMQTGSITVEGETGLLTGQLMENGRIIVESGASNRAGSHLDGGEIGIRNSNTEEVGDRMKDGIIWHEGDIQEAGSQMEGGTIYVQSSVEKAGYSSTGGEIYVEHAIDEIGDNCGADVYLWEKSEWIEITEEDI